MEMQILRLHSRGRSPTACVYTSPPGDSGAHSSEELLEIECSLPLPPTLEPPIFVTH